MSPRPSFQPQQPEPPEQDDGGDWVYEPPEHPGQNEIIMPERVIGYHAPYQANYAEITFRFTLLGVPVEQIAEAIGVSKVTFYKWLRQKPALREALDRGRLFADAHVAHSLYLRATGYTHEAVKIFYDRETGRPVLVPYRNHVPPDVNAAKFWLSNRNRKEGWQERQTTELTGPNGESLLAPVLNITPVKAIARE